MFLAMPQASSLPSAPMPPLRVLLIDDGAHHVQLIRDELTRQGHAVVGVIDSATLVHDCVLRLLPDIVIVDSESPTRDTLENLAVLSSNSPRPVVMFTNDDGTDPLRQALQAGVSAYVVDGLQPARLMPVLQVAMARFEQDKALRQQLAQAQNQLSERKTLEQAKGILMAQARMTEAEAHQHMRKLAMDRGQKLVALAEQIIDADKLLNPRT
jgi:response regulator NasT